MLLLLYFRQEMYVFVDDDKCVSQLIVTAFFNGQNKALKYSKKNKPKQNQRSQNDSLTNFSCHSKVTVFFV